MNVPFLDKIPLDPRICEASDLGKPFIIANPGSKSTKAFMNIVKKITEIIK